MFCLLAQCKHFVWRMFSLINYIYSYFQIRSNEKMKNKFYLRYWSAGQMKKTYSSVCFQILKQMKHRVLIFN